MLNEKEENSHYSIDKYIDIIPVRKSLRRNNPIKKLMILRQCLKTIKPDVVISFLHHISIYTHFSLLGLKIPHIVSERNDPVQYPEKKLLRFLRDYTFIKADGCVFQTAGAKNYFPAIVQNKSVIIPNPVVIMHESARPFMREKKIAAVGRLIPQKNYNMMIRAFARFSEQVPDYKLFICGEGPLRFDIEKLIKSLGLADSIMLMGQVKNPHEIIFDSAVFALSSDHEGMPNALLEAMALGVPSVSTDCPSGGAANLVKNYENGILVPVGDVQAMADAFKMITGDPEFSSKLSENGKQLLLTYSIDSIAEKWLRYIYTMVISDAHSFNSS